MATSRTYKRKVDLVPFTSWEQLLGMEDFLHEHFGSEDLVISLFDDQGSVRASSVAEAKQEFASDDLPKSAIFSYFNRLGSSSGQPYAQVLWDQPGKLTSQNWVDIEGSNERDVVGVAAVLRERIDADRLVPKPKILLPAIEQPIFERNTSSPELFDEQGIQPQPKSSSGIGHGRLRRLWSRIGDATAAQVAGGLICAGIVGLLGRILGLI